MNLGQVSDLKRSELTRRVGLDASANYIVRAPASLQGLPTITRTSKNVDIDSVEMLLFEVRALTVSAKIAIQIILNKQKRFIKWPRGTSPNMKRKNILHQGKFSLTSLSSEKGPESCLTSSGLTVGLATPICCGSLARLMASSIIALSVALFVCLCVGPLEGAPPLRVSWVKIALTDEDRAE